MLDLRELKDKRQKILKGKKDPLALVTRDTSFPALLLLKNHTLASSSIKLFLRQLLDRYSDSLELITPIPMIGCLPPPEDDLSFWGEEEVSFSDSETYVGEEDWIMDVESQHGECHDILCV